MRKGKKKSKSAEGGKRTCKERIGGRFKETVTSLRALWEAYQKGNDGSVEGLGTFTEYGLGFDYVAPDTRRGIREPYFRYQLSWGGPSDEFRFFACYTGGGWKPYRIEYWFMDWFDGARRILKGKNRVLLEQIFMWFDECSSTENAFREAMEA